MVKRLSQLCKGMGIPCTMEDGSTFTVERNFRMDLVFHAGALVDTRSARYRDKGLLLYINFVEVQAVSHLPHSSTSNGVTAAAAKTRKQTHYEGSFDPRGISLNTFAVESFEHLGKQAESFRFELAVHMI
ncbi:unnamed protein product, partial [Choristocarpus tenellus]